jgi:hypothetical protein
MWAPSAISGIKAWYRYDLQVTTSGGTVSQVLDQSGNGRTISQGTSADQPGYVAGSSGTAHLVYSTSAQALQGSGFSLTQPFEEIVVAYSSSSSPGAGQYLLDWSPGNNNLVYQPAGTQSLELYDGSNACVVSIPTVNAIFVADAFFSGSSSTLSINGGTAATGNPGTTAPGSSISIGNFYSSLANGWKGGIYEDIVVGNKISGGDQTNLQAYLKSLYGVN